MHIPTLCLLEDNLAQPGVGVGFVAGICFTYFKPSAYHQLCFNRLHATDLNLGRPMIAAYALFAISVHRGN